MAQAHRRRGRPGAGGSHAGPGVSDYGLVKGKPTRQELNRPGDPRNKPHLHILTVAGDEGFDVTVDVFSKEGSEVLFLVRPNFAPAKAAELIALPPGSTPIGSNHADGLGLDYIRQHLVSPDELALLPIDPNDIDNDLHNGLSDLVEQAIEAQADLYAFGSLFDDSQGGRGGPNLFDIDPLVGIHNIHMNQGNPSGSFGGENGTFQDGGLLVHFTGARDFWVAVYIAFQSQSFATDEASRAAASKAVEPTRIVPGRHRPPFLTRPAEFREPIAAERLDHILKNLQPIPKPLRQPPVLPLEQVIGADAVRSILESGQIVIHAVGDTGRGDHTAQTDVADAMAADFDRPNPADHPAFFFHLGDVIYGSHKDQLYRDLFYRPYDHYPGQIVAIPGNHDGEVFKQTDPETLRAFLANFCDSRPQHPAIAGTIPRTTMAQPGVYFLLEAPFVRIIGLYSNVAENPGFISGETIGDAQKQFLVDQLAAIGKLRAKGDTDALVLAVHHPPYSGGGHSGSRDMLADIDDAVKKAGVVPDLVLSAHAHNYQRYTRKFVLDGVVRQIPFFVAGGGGKGITPIKLAEGSQPVNGPLPGNTGDHTLEQYYNGFGYLTLTVTKQVLTVDFFAVPASTDVPLDTMTLDFHAHKITHQAPPLTHPLPSESRGGNRFDAE